MHVYVQLLRANVLRNTLYRLPQSEYGEQTSDTRAHQLPETSFTLECQESPK